MKIYHWLMGLLFPPRCILCRRVLKKEELDLCRECRCDAPDYCGRKSKLQFLDSFCAIWYYRGNVRSSLLRYKFGYARSYAHGYGRLLAGKLLQDYPDGFDVLTWVPISSLREFSRGYDQSRLIAQAVGRELGMTPVRTLKKTRNNPRQSRIKGAAQRRANVLGVYEIQNSEAIAGKRILLLDDILTTGATAGECARMLLTAGAKEVHCAVVAAARKEE